MGLLLASISGGGGRINAPICPKLKNSKREREIRGSKSHRRTHNRFPFERKLWHFKKLKWEYLARREELWGFPSRVFSPWRKKRITDAPRFPIVLSPPPLSLSRPTAPHPFSSYVLYHPLLQPPNPALFLKSSPTFCFKVRLQVRKRKIFVSRILFLKISKQ